MTQPHLYRHDSVITQRPYGVDVSPDGWLWEGSSGNRLLGHNINTGELRVVIVPEMEGHPIYSTYYWDGKLVMQMGEFRYYLVYDLTTGKCVRREIPGEKPIAWYGTRLPKNRLMLCDRGGGQAVILDGPEAQPRMIPFPYKGDFASMSIEDDGLGYTFLADPHRVVRFDPATEKFIDEKPTPYPETGTSGRFSYGGVLYTSDSSGGRLLPLDLKTQKWLDPISHPDHKKVFGFIGGGFRIGSVGYFCLSTYAQRSKLDTKTGQIIIPPGPLTIDGSPRSRFMERMLTFDAATKKFDYIIAPPQPDGVPLLCYAWTDGKKFAVTGCLLPFEAGGKAGPEPGPWIVLQSEPVAAKPFGPFDFKHDRFVQMHRRRRSYAYTRSVYLPEMPSTPPTVNVEGVATAFEPGVNAELIRRAAATDPKTYWSAIAKGCIPSNADEATAFKHILMHVNRYIYYNPIQVPQTFDPIAIHEAREGRCGHGVGVTLALCAAAGIEARSTGLQNHVVAEARYGGSWHIGDALFFGRDQPAKDGRVLSVEELKADPYFADAYPQWCFAYDPELLVSEDGYQVLGYVFGLWGSEPYYSFYLGAPKDCPPTLPAMLPAQRLDDKTLRLNWSRSIKHNAPDAVIEYDLRVYTDRGCQQEIFQRLTKETSTTFPVPEANRMYYAQVRAMDDHRKKNAQTWYPPTRWNFVLAPREQYGWYGVL